MFLRHLNDEYLYLNVTYIAGGRYKSWKRRWFILNDNCLYYFEYTTDKEPRGIIPLENIQVCYKFKLLFKWKRLSWWKFNVIRLICDILHIYLFGRWERLLTGTSHTVLSFTQQGQNSSRLARLIARGKWSKVS